MSISGMDDDDLMIYRESRKELVPRAFSQLVPGEESDFPGGDICLGGWGIINI